MWVDCSAPCSLQPTFAYSLVQVPHQYGTAMAVPALQATMGLQAIIIDANDISPSRLLIELPEGKLPPLKKRTLELTSGLAEGEPATVIRREAPELGLHVVNLPRLT